MPSTQGAGHPKPRGRVPADCYWDVRLTLKRVSFCHRATTESTKTQSSRLGSLTFRKNCDGAIAKSNASTNGPAQCLSSVVKLAQAHKRAQSAAASRRREMPPATKPRGIA